MSSPAKDPTRLIASMFCALALAGMPLRSAAAYTQQEIATARKPMDQAAEMECKLQVQMMERELDLVHRYGSNMARSMKSEHFGQCMSTVTVNLDLMWDMIETNRIPNVKAVFDQCQVSLGDLKTIEQREDWRKPALLALFAICIHSHGRTY